MLDLIDNALLASKRLPSKMRNIFLPKARVRTGREFCAYEETGFAKRAASHEAHL